MDDTDPFKSTASEHLRQAISHLSYARTQARDTPAWHFVHDAWLAAVTALEVLEKTDG